MFRGVKSGHQEFSKAKNTILTDLEKMELLEVRHFLDCYIESFTLTIDELN
ncbi:MAG: hypothetical protein KGZ94_04135 [Clostridia bacterium]|nr:hypothetical protein [Clostridia bacterium]